MSEEIEVIPQNNDVVLSKTQYEDMTRTIQVLKSQLKENEKECYSVKQVWINGFYIYFHIYIAI